MKITAGIFLYDSSKNKFLVCHATGSPYHKWSIPKGIIEEGESKFEAAIRELAEESNINIKNYNIRLYELPIVKYKSGKKMLVSFLIIVNEINFDHIKCNSYFYRNDVKVAEIDSFKFIHLNEFSQLHESQESLKPAIEKCLMLNI